MTKDTRSKTKTLSGHGPHTQSRLDLAFISASISQLYLASISYRSTSCPVAASPSTACHHEHQAPNRVSFESLDLEHRGTHGWVNLKMMVGQSVNLTKVMATSLVDVGLRTLFYLPGSGAICRYQRLMAIKCKRRLVLTGQLTAHGSRLTALHGCGLCAVQGLPSKTNLLNSRDTCPTITKHR